MSLYQKFFEIGVKIFAKSTLFKWGYNLSPMYRRTTARITEVSKDLLLIKIRLPLSYKNKNYVNSIFGGSMFSAVDPIPMVQLINLLDKNYVVWDKSAKVRFKIPAREDLYAQFSFSEEEVEQIKKRIKTENEIEISKVTALTNKTGDKIFCEITKVIYVADMDFYKRKRGKK
jgi:hypothetical protein